MFEELREQVKGNTGKPIYTYIKANLTNLIIVEPPRHTVSQTHCLDKCLHWRGPMHRDGQVTPR